MASFKKWRDRRRNPWKGVFYDAFKAWKRENGPGRLYDYGDLPAGAVVLDFGAYKGEWADIVLGQQPDCHLHLFEPHPGFAAALVTKYAGDARVTVHDHALGRRAGALTLSDAENASSAVADHDKGVEARVVSAADFFAGGHFPRIDLVKMNIEGGEYDLLPALIETGVIRRIARLQVQFHLFAERMVPMRDAIRNDLDRTHECAWCYPFVWEEWRQTGVG
ncbi:FkbM family methyltransferase [Roseovarius sp. SYSU LYC5161]|uniref:FkbM family methyltransferase n=1 Tax=Roseovarius halophilus (ex Wu et al. 2025) TaxID=3376060 RepID=UPI00399B81A7